LGAEYYVATTGNNSNSGLSRTNAWATLQYAVDNVVTGDTVVVLAGTYSGFWVMWSASVTAPITVKADEGSTVVLNSLGTPNQRNCIVEFAHVLGDPISGWIVQGFEIAGSPRHGVGIFALEESPHHNITIRNNVVRDSTRTGIFTGFSDDLVIDGNECYGNGEHGIYCSNSGDRPRISRNRCYLNAASGIQLNADAGAGGDGIMSGALIDSNVVYSNSTDAGIGAGINLDGVTDSTVANNLIYDNNDAQGIALFKGDGGVGSRGNLVIHNTIIHGDTAGPGNWALNISDDGCVSNRVLNNVILTDSPYNGSINVVDPQMLGFTSDHNVVVDRFSTNEGDTVMSLEQWQGFGLDTHSFIATPLSLFRSHAEKDFRLVEYAPAIDKGDSIAGPTLDAGGGSRLYGCAPDIGAYEWRVEGLLLIVADAGHGSRLPLGVHEVDELLGRR
jgi:parallel beta-helix repeat protein